MGEIKVAPFWVSLEKMFARGLSSLSCRVATIVDACKKCHRGQESIYYRLSGRKAVFSEKKLQKKVEKFSFLYYYFTLRIEEISPFAVHARNIWAEMALR